MSKRTPEQAAAHREYMRRYRQTPQGKAKIAACQQRYQQRNREMIKDYWRRYYAEHRAEIAALQHAYWDALPEEEKERRREMSRQYMRNLSPEKKREYEEARRESHKWCAEKMEEHGAPRTRFRSQPPSDE